MLLRDRFRVNGNLRTMSTLTRQNQTTVTGTITENRFILRIPKLTLTVTFPGTNQGSVVLGAARARQPLTRVRGCDRELAGMHVALELVMFHRALAQTKCSGAAVVAAVTLCCMAPGLAGAADRAAPAEEKSQRVSDPAGLVRVSALGGFGYGNGVRLGDDDYLGVGYGVRGGYTFAGTPLYLGGTLLRYLGPSGGSYDVDSGSLDFEIGYEIVAGPIVVRPYLGVGALVTAWSLRNGASAEGGETGNSGLAPRVVPGLLVWHPIGIVAVGAEARYEQTANGQDRALALMGSIGVRF